MLLIALVFACGGGSANDTSATTVSAASTSAAATQSPVALDSNDSGALLDRWASYSRSGQALAIDPVDATEAALGRAARLNQTELNRRQGASTKAAALGTLNRKSYSGLIPVYRFLNTTTGAHFYTASAQERDLIGATLPQFNYEGEAFLVSPVAQGGLLPVHRFYNTTTGVHLYTISEDEKSYIQTNLPAYAYEGIAYYASATGGSGLKPLYRFYRTDRKFHFYSASYVERDNVLNTLCDYRYEGISYYVMDPSATTEPPAAVPNSVVLVVGDSLAQGYGRAIDGSYYAFVTPGRVWTEVLANEIKTRTGRNCNRLVNVSVGGMRTDDGLARIQGWLDQYAPTHVILAQGTNDAWQGLGLTFISNNLNAMAQASLAAHAKVLVMDYSFYLYGSTFRVQLTTTYQAVAAGNSGTYFLGTAGIPLSGTYYHGDNVHLKDAAEPVVVEKVWDALSPLL